MYLSYFLRRLALVLSALIPASAATAALVLDDLNGYSTDFDFLSTGGSVNAWVNDQSVESTSGSPGWYWQNGATSLTYEGSAQSGEGVLSLRTAGDTSMGGRPTAAMPHIAWGIVFHNNSGETISQVEVNYTGHQWSRADHASDTLHFSFMISASEITDLNPAGGAAPPGWTSEADLSFVAPVAPKTDGLFYYFDRIPPHTDTDGVPPYQDLSGLLDVTIPDGHYLALRWETGDDGGAASQDATMSIDNLSVGFTVAAVPEAGSVLFGTFVCGVLGLGYGGKRLAKFARRQRYTVPCLGEPATRSL